MIEKTKLYILILSLISIMLFTGTVYAGCLYNHAAAGVNLEYESNGPNASMHTVNAYCKTCGGWQYSSDELHKGGSWYSVDENYHKIVCLCGHTMNAKAAHQMSYRPISSTQCRGDCASCGYYIIKNHNFVNNVCSHCGAKSGSNFATTLENNNEYFVVKNIENSALTVNIEVWGASGYDSGAYRKLIFTDSVPANTTRVYVKAFVDYGGIVSKAILLGYYDVGTGNSGALALVNRYRTDATGAFKPTNNVQLKTGVSFTIATPTNASASSTAWATTSGSGVVYKPVSETTWLRGAVNEGKCDFLFKGKRGDVATGVTVSSASGSLPNGYVAISYQDNHTCSFSTTYSKTATTHTAVSKCTNSKCGKTITGTAEAHTWDTNHICTVCSYPGSHSYGDYTVTVAATCTTVGNKVRSCVCGAQQYEVIPKLNHNPGAAATCTTPQICTRCSAVIVPALGHTYGAYVANGTSGHRQLCSTCNTYSTTVAHDYGAVSPSASTAGCHSKVCNTCGYEADIAAHTMAVYTYGQSSGTYYHSLKCNSCSYTQNGITCTMNSVVTKVSTCTETGTSRNTCSVCSQTYDSTIDKIPHSWSDWETTKTEHYKICNYGCGNESSRGTHVDTNPKNARCDVCDYLMYIIPIGRAEPIGDEDQIADGSIPSLTVKENETAEFCVVLTEGSQPLSYQWYYKTSSSGTDNKILGATSSTYSFEATKDMDGRLYHCVVSNPGGSLTTNSAKLTVYYQFTISPQPTDINLKKGESGTFTVGIGTAGNPNSYTYQWYVANSKDGAGSKISNATTKSYQVTPKTNIGAEYYYCIVSNGVYTITSNRAKLTADITTPEVTAGSFNDGAIINKAATLTIPLIVTDTGEGYTEGGSNFTKEDIVVKVAGTVVNPTKTLTYKGASGKNYNYELVLKNITGNGKLTIEVPNNSIKDDFGNGNLLQTISTSVIIDNVAPVLLFESIEGDINERYLNSSDSITINFAIEEAIGINLNELTIDDIVINVGGQKANDDINKTFKYVEKKGNKYIYQLTIKNIKGDGELTLNIPASSIKDLALNSNVSANLVIKNDKGNIVVDNTKPVIDSVVASLGSYNNSSKLYPGSLDSIHGNWAKENVYLQINVTENQKVDYYMKSIGNNNSYQKVASASANINTYQELFTNDSINNIIYYRVVDKAGNYAETSYTIKIDKITPNKPIISLFEQVVNGAEYVYDEYKATDKSVYVIPNPSSIVDVGTVNSGIQKRIEDTYYIIKSYVDKTKSEQLRAPAKFAWNEGFLLDETGYYEIQMTMTDVAGNQVIGEVYKVYINKKAENTIRISKINDIGSGIKKATIQVFKSDEAGNQMSEEAIEAIIIENPYKEIIRNVRLGEGTYYVEVTLEDNVGLTTVLKSTIVNEL